MVITDGTTTELEKRARKFGYSGMFTVADTEWTEEMIKAFPQEYQIPALTLVMGVTNAMALELAKADMALEAHGIVLEEE